MSSEMPSEDTKTQKAIIKEIALYVKEFFTLQIYVKSVDL